MYSIRETFVFQTEISTFRIFIRGWCCFSFLSSPRGSVCCFNFFLSVLITKSARTCRCHGKWSFFGSSVFLVVKNPCDLRSQVRITNPFLDSPPKNAANRPLPSSKNSHFQYEAKCTTFLVKMSFICTRMKNYFHIKGWALNLALIQRPGGTRKWPISLCFLIQWNLT